MSRPEKRKRRRYIICRYMYIHARPCPHRRDNLIDSVGVLSMLSLLILLTYCMKQVILPLSGGAEGSRGSEDGAEPFDYKTHHDPVPVGGAATEVSMAAGCIPSGTPFFKSASLGVGQTRCTCIYLLCTCTHVCTRTWMIIIIHRKIGM